MSGLQKAKSGKKNRKHGRNKAFCERYRLSGQRERNKARKLRRHLAKFPDDLTAKHALGALNTLRAAE